VHAESRARSTPRGVQPSLGARLPGIEGLRALAAGSILVFHVWGFTPTNGRRLGPVDRVVPDLRFGVVLFFTLSGFLLYRPFAGAILRSRHRPSLARYLRNRALRILPAYWFILLASFVIGSFFFWDASRGLVGGRPEHPLLVIRAALLLQDYSPATILNGIGPPVWSLAVEAVFYLSLPLLVLVAGRLAERATTRRARNVVLLFPPALLLAIGLAGKLAAEFLVPPRFAYAGFDQNWHSVLERSFVCQADLFAFGMAVAVLRVNWEDGLVRLPRSWRFAAGALALGMYGAVTATFHGEQLSYSEANTVVAAACGLALAVVVVRRPGSSRLVGFLETRPMIAAGVVSYSVFLWHVPLIWWLGAHELLHGGTGGFFLNLLLAGAATGIASVATYLLVEAPALRLKLHGSSEPPVPTSQIEAAP
jgi:peptidoglycan/LPS O-acetylase OafA/YrhL